MKKLSFIYVAVLLTAFAGCKKKSDDSSGGTKKAAASVKKDLGFDPQVTVSVNMASLKKTPFYGLFKKQIMKKIKVECAKELINDISKIFFVGRDFKGKGKPSVYAAIAGVDADKLMKCAQKEGKDKQKMGKFKGKEAMIIEEDGQKTFVFKGSAKNVVVVTGEAGKNVKPGEGTFGKGDISKFVGSKSLSFNVKGVDDKFSAVSGYVDFSSGLKADVAVEMKEVKAAEKMAKQFEMGKAMMAGKPEIKKLIEKIDFSQSGKSIKVKTDLSEDDLKKVMKMAGPMMGKALR
ncbi:MAG: hypothetical protein PF689_07930 [Deltaproteobacteria bacterium]|jgi:hypothetical protein|nr:hypothetical protein [Deltaproteobacteria bacterium]